jgi:hypothetical protein
MPEHQINYSPSSTNRERDCTITFFTFQCQNYKDILRVSSKSSCDVASLSSTTSLFPTAVLSAVIVCCDEEEWQLVRCCILFFFFFLFLFQIYPVVSHCLSSKDGQGFAISKLAPLHILHSEKMWLGGEYTRYLYLDCRQS